MVTAVAERACLQTLLAFATGAHNFVGPGVRLCWIALPPEACVVLCLPLRCCPVAFRVWCVFSVLCSGIVS